MPIFIINLIFLILTSCRNDKMLIKHAEELTLIDYRKIDGRSTPQINREDNFILYGFTCSQKDSIAIKECIKNYSDSFSAQYDNYSMFFYNESSTADTNYIKQFEKKYAYKAILHDKPIMEFYWWSNKLYSKPVGF